MDVFPTPPFPDPTAIVLMSTPPEELPELRLDRRGRDEERDLLDGDSQDLALQPV